MSEQQIYGYFQLYSADKPYFLFNYFNTHFTISFDKRCTYHVPVNVEIKKMLGLRREGEKPDVSLWRIINFYSKDKTVQRLEIIGDQLNYGFLNKDNSSSSYVSRSKIPEKYIKKIVQIFDQIFTDSEYEPIKVRNTTIKNCGINTIFTCKTITTKIVKK